LDTLLKGPNGPRLHDAINQSVEVIFKALTTKKPLLICGNGGSAADAQHIAGELVGRCFKEHEPLRAMALSADSAVLTCLGNDYGYEMIFARQVKAYADSGGILLAISTSGNSPNVIKALEAARDLGMHTIGLTGETGGAMAPLCDILINVPGTIAPHIQEIHVLVYHYLCYAIENKLTQTHV
jgi:D-sedoheptulose 7-phosphate isomerase